VGDTVKDKSNSIRFLVLCQSWILGAYHPISAFLATSMQSASVMTLPTQFCP